MKSTLEEGGDWYREGLYFHSHAKGSGCGLLVGLVKIHKRIHPSTENSRQTRVGEGRNRQRGKGQSPRISILMEFDLKF